MLPASPTHCHHTPRTSASSCSRVSAILVPPFAGQSKRPAWSRRAASQTPMPSSLRAFLRWRAGAQTRRRGAVAPHRTRAPLAPGQLRFQRACPVAPKAGQIASRPSGQAKATDVALWRSSIRIREVTRAATPAIASGTTSPEVGSSGSPEHALRVATRGPCRRSIRWPAPSSRPTQAARIRRRPAP